MTSTAFVNVSSNAASSNSSTVRRRESKDKEKTYDFNSGQGTPETLFSSVSELDAKIAKLEKEAKKSKGGWFSKVYNVFSKKDNKLEKEIEELKEAKKAAEADGVITQQELAGINKEYTEAGESLNTYKDGKKHVADTASTIAAIGAGVAIGVATGGAGLVVVAAAGAAASGAAKMISKEVMLGDEYEMLGKEGLKDGLISAAYGATGGVVSVAGKAAAPLITSAAGRIGVNVSAKAATTVATYGTKMVADEALMAGIKVANGQEVTAGDVFATGVASLAFTKAGNTLKNTNLFKITEHTGDLAKVGKIGTVAAGTYVGKGKMRHVINDITS